MPEPVAELTLALLGNPASFDKMLEQAEARLDRFARKVDSIGGKLQASLDKTLSGVATNAGKLDTALEPVITAWGNVGMSASVAGEEVKKASAELRDAKDDANAAARSLKDVGEAGSKMGTGVAEGMKKTSDSVAAGKRSLSGFLETVNRVRAAASKPIVQRVRIERTGESAGGSTRGAGREGLTSAGYGLIMGGGAILAAEGELIKSGEGTEDALRRLYATAGETENYETLRREVLGIATQFGLMPEDVAKALYPIRSLGFMGADGMKVLAASAQMAKGSQADLLLVTDLVAKTLNAYGLSADHAGRLTDIFTKAIKDGVVPGKDYVSAYAGVMTVSKSAEISVEETAAALAVLTHNAKSAAVGSTQLRAFISGIIAPTKAMRDAAKAAGLEWLATGHGADELKRVGLSGTLDEITKATNGNVHALTELFPDLRKVQAGLALLNNGGVVFTRTLKDVQNSQGATAQSSKAMDASLAQSGRNMQAAYAAAGSNLEDALEPDLTKIFGIVTNLINAFNRLPTGVQKGIGVTVGLTGAVMVLGGAGLIVTRWVLSVGDLFARMAVKGVAANTAVAASATEAAAAEASVGTTGEASAAELQAAATGMMTANEEAAASAEAAGAAEAGVGTAATGAGAATLAAFGPGSLVILALAAMVWSISRTVDMYQQMRQAIDDAASAQQRLTDKIADMQAAGGQSAMIGTRAKVLSESSDLTNAIEGAKNGDAQGYIGVGEYPAVAKLLRDKGYDTSKPGYRSMDEINARIHALDADADKLGAAIQQAHSDGVNGNTKAAHGAGADGFALAVANVDPKSIVTDAVGQTCANFVSKVFMRAGLALDKPINRASDLRDKIVKMGGQEHGGPALPGDLVFYDGPAFTRRRDGSKGSGHVAYADGAGGDWESTHGRTSHKSIEGNLAWAAKNGGGTAHFYTVPGSTFANVSPGATLPPNNGGAEPAWAQHLGDGKSKKPKPEAAGSLQDISLRHLDDVLPADLTQLATGAGNYEEKLGRLNDALEEHDAKMQESGKGYDKYAAKISELATRLILAQNAIQNTGREIETLSPKVQAEEAKVRSAQGAFNAQSDKMKGQRQAGLPKSDPAAWQAEIRQHEALRSAYTADLAAYQRDEAALKENRRVHKQARDNKDRDLAEMDAARTEQEQKATEQFLKQQSGAVKLGPDQPGGISRDQYDQNLQGALAGQNKSIGTMNPEGDDYARVQEALTQSAVARQQAQGRISRETLQLQKKDFDALQQDLGDEVQAYRDAGVAETDIGVWRNLKQHEIDMARNAQSRKDLVDGGKEMLDLGLETATQYQQQLGKAIASLQADWASAGTEAERQDFGLQIAKLKLEMDKIDWDAAAQKADDYRQALETGKLGIEEYILRLKDLEANLPHTSEEYKRLAGEINSANKEIYDKAEQTAGGIASKMSDSFMQVIHHATTMRQAVRDLFKTTLDDAVKKQIEDTLKNVVLKMVLQADAGKMQKAADQHKKAADSLAKLSEGDKMTAAAKTQSTASTLFSGAAATMHTAVATMGQGIATFAASVDKFVGSSSPPGAGAAPTGPAAPAGSGSGSGSGSGIGNDVTSAISGAASGGAAGAALAAAQASGQGGAATQIGASILPDLQKGNDAGAAETGTEQAAALGFLGNTAASALPYIGAVIALASMFGPTKHTPTSTQSQKYAGVLTSFSPTIDSGYSGSDGLRTLLGPVSRAQAGVSSQGQAQPILNVTIAANAFNGVADPQQHATVFVQSIAGQMAKMSALDNASRGEG